MFFHVKFGWADLSFRGHNWYGRLSASHRFPDLALDRQALLSLFNILFTKQVIGNYFLVTYLGIAKVWWPSNREICIQPLCIAFLSQYERSCIQQSYTQHLMLIVNKSEFGKLQPAPCIISLLQMGKNWLHETTRTCVALQTFKWLYKGERRPA